MTSKEQQQAARHFVETWKEMKGDEKQRTQQFWTDIIRNIFGVEDTTSYIQFEHPVIVNGHTKFIDVYIPSRNVLIEQKSAYKNLDQPITQSGGDLLTPYQQAKRYDDNLAVQDKAKWIITCNFDEIWVYDMRKAHPDPFKIAVANLEKEFHQLNFLVKEVNEELQHEFEVSVKAGKIVAAIYDALSSLYIDKSEQSLSSLNRLCVRLVFCFYAEDANVFGGKNEFHDYFQDIPASQWRRALIEFFQVLDTPKEQRKYIEDQLNEFPYVNGGLFSGDIEIPQFTEELKTLILNRASADFDWSEISPTIFGAVFESTLNPETRRSGGMHYTSVENIHKLIDPLFLNDLNLEYETICKKYSGNEQRKRLMAFQERLSSYTFLDPACGSGNFLTETYISLRKLENKLILQTHGAQTVLADFASPIKVNIHQFYGIEINDFAVDVAKTALWIAELQMKHKLEHQIARFQISDLPLKTYSNILHGNALTTDWEDAIPAEKLNYIIGNPPFVGARMKSQSQADDMLEIFGKQWKNIGNLDYVGGWYLKAAQLMQTNPAIRAALVSTNSITQGEQVAILWEPLFEQYGIHFDFAYPTFRWDSESNLKAHVHCVILGFSNVSSVMADGIRRLYRSDGTYQACSNINGYLVDGPSVFIDSRTKPLCDVPEMGIGNKPIDGGFYLFKPEEKEEFVKIEPSSEKYFKPFYGAEEFINGKIRYCLWLGNCTPSELRSMPHCLERVASVRDFRLASKSEGTRKIADTPTHFHVENMPDTNYLLVPRVSSERRKYVPIGFMSPNDLSSDSVQLIPSATLYHFGVLTSNVHMAWMRAVCGRLKSDYRYSKDIVYNNFPWPSPTEEQKAKIEQTAQAILGARSLYPESSLADLYDEVTMPVELRRAHQANDRAVMAAYGFKSGPDFTESTCVAHLLEMYQNMTK